MTFFAKLENNAPNNVWDKHFPLAIERMERVSRIVKSKRKGNEYEYSKARPEERLRVSLRVMYNISELDGRPLRTGVNHASSSKQERMVIVSNTRYAVNG